MRVLHIITGLNVGGAENMLAKLMEADPEPETQRVLSLLPRGPLANRIEKAGVRVDTLNMTRGLPSPQAGFRLAAYVRSAKPDLLHGWMYHGNLAVSFARLFAPGRPPAIWNVRHSLSDPRLETPLTRALLALSRRLSERPEAIVYNSEAAAIQHEAYGFSPEHRQVIPNGFDCVKFRQNPAARQRIESLFGIPQDVFLLGCIARLHPMKGHATLLEAAMIASARRCRLHLLMVGEGWQDPPEGLRRLVEALPAGTATTSGARFDVADWMPGLDALVVPSGWGEGFPNVIGEALLCGVPAIATDVGDSAKIVRGDGAVVPPNDPGAMADAVQQLSAMAPNQRRAMGQAGRKRIEDKYSLESIARSYRELYRAMAFPEA